MKTKKFFLYSYRTVLGVVFFFSWASLEPTVKNDKWWWSALIAIISISLLVLSFKKIRLQLGIKN